MGYLDKAGLSRAFTKLKTLIDKKQDAMKTVVVPSSSSTNKGKWIKFATVDLSSASAWAQCSGTLSFIRNEGESPLGLLKFEFRNGGTAGTVTTKELYWTNLNNGNHASAVASVKVSDGKYDIYYKPINDYETPVVSLVDSANSKYFTFNTGSYVASVTAASTSGVNSCASSLTTARTIQTNLGSTSSVSINGATNVTPGVTGTLSVSNGGTGATTLTSGAALIGNGTGVIATRSITNMTSANYINYNTNLMTTNTLAYWNGSYNANGGSNLLYCNKGAFGTAVTYSATSSITKGSDSLITSGAVYAGLEGKASTAVATASANGLMSADDKTKLNGIATGANNYSLPTATSSVLGGVRVDDAVSLTSANPVQNKIITAEVNKKANASDLTSHTGNTTVHITTNERSTWNAKASTAVATASANGLMPSTDKAKLDALGGIVSIQKSLTLKTDWQNTGIASNNLSTGTYVVQVSGLTSDDGLSTYSEIWSGVMSWYDSNTNSTESDEIFLHKAGHAPNGNDIYLRTMRNSSGTLVLQIAATANASKADAITFKFRKLI